MITITVVMGLVVVVMTTVFTVYYSRLLKNNKYLDNLLTEYKGKYLESENLRLETFSKLRDKESEIDRLYRFETKYNNLLEEIKTIDKIILYNELTDELTTVGDYVIIGKL